MEEPKITVINIDETTNIGTDPVANRLNILCPVISPAGPTELTEVSGPSEFKRLFFGGAGISGTDDITAIYARSLVNNAPIWVKRAVRDTLKAGISSETASPIYVDENLLPVGGVKFKLSPNDIVTIADSVEDFMTENTSGNIQRGNMIYTSGDSSEAFPETAVKSESEKTIRTILKFVTTESNPATSGPITITIGNTRLTVDSNASDLTHLLYVMLERGIYPQYIKCTSGNLIDTEFNALTSEEDFTVKGVSEIGWVAPITIDIVVSEQSDEGKIKLDTYTASSASQKITCFTLKTEQENIDTWELTNPSIEFSIDDDTYGLYCGEYKGTAKIKYNLGNASPTFNEFCSLIISRLSDSLHGASAGSDTFVLPNVDSVTATGVSISNETINQVAESERFAIISRFPCDEPFFSASLSWADEENQVYRLSVNYQNIEEQWDFGFNASLVDGYGNSLYYDRVNADSELIYIVELNGEGVTIPMSTTFGNEVTSHYSDVDDIINSLESMSENDEPTVKFDFICDGGMYNTTFISVIKTLCEKYHSYYPVSIPTNFNKSEVKTYRNNCGSFPQGNFIPHTQRGSTIDNGTVILPASYWYLTRRIELGNTAQEFMGLFGTNGYINIDNPLQIYTVDEREDFLDSQIPTLKRTSSGSYSLNRNFTLYKTQSYLQEDGIVLMNNKIAQLADQYGETLIGRTGSENLRAKVESELGSILSNRMRVGTEYAPTSLRVQCDNSNNPETLQRLGKIRIDIYGTYGASIREVLIYSTIQAL